MTLDVLDDLNAMDAVNAASVSLRGDDLASHAPSRGERAIVSSLYSDSYLPGILTLAQSLTTVNTGARYVLLYFPERISPRSACLAQEAGWELVPVERIAPPDNRRLYYRYVDQYTKLRIWTLDTIGVKVGVYLDGDTVVNRNVDELFTLPYTFAAVPDVYLPGPGFVMDINAGVLVFRPSTAVFEDMMQKVPSAKYNHGDSEQGFLRMYFARQVLRLPHIYNANMAIKYRALNAWHAIMDDLRIIHYTLVKPFPEDNPMIEDPVKSEALVRKTLNERKASKNGFWKSEMELWERHYNASVRSMDGKCLL
ncbi:nucleotide-diphospho-sugar transferase [Schizopora paradoxa]|uniref:Nucleotide-diphospho-sugar transferase n=1 Tax=Schizopora paradoxa TaxID=27342 RepID=A0A0H2RWI1_9AGAM|nr:nucleotide-diphospho-sugar transferase [Schizopora paradoxa]